MNVYGRNKNRAPDKNKYLLMDPKLKCLFKVFKLFLFMWV